MASDGELQPPKDPPTEPAEATTDEAPTGAPSRRLRSRVPWASWWARPTIRTIRTRQMERDRPDYRVEWDQRDNNELQPPSDDMLCFAGLVLTEAFTPSTVASLFHTVEHWPTTSERDRTQRTEALRRSRHGRHSGRISLGVARPPGAFVFGIGHHDGGLPTHVDAAWVQVHFVSASLTIVTATFQFQEMFGDKATAILRQHFPTAHRDPEIHVEGRWGAVRARIPWARPKRYMSTSTVSSPESEKRRVLEEWMSATERDCAKWFFGKFPGRFSHVSESERPTARLLLTTTAVPFVTGPKWLRPAGLASSFEVYRSVDVPGWALRPNDRAIDSRSSQVATFAARRADAARSPDGGHDPGTSNWYLAQRFSDEQSSLLVKLTVRALLNLYWQHLAALRDQAAQPRRIRRPIRDARRLDTYLVGDGLDAATITHELAEVTDNLTVFRWNTPEYSEDLSERQTPNHASRSPIEYVPALRAAIRDEAAQLASSTEAATGNIRSSSELRQATANTRLQRAVVVFSVLAVAIALITFIAS